MRRAVLSLGGTLLVAIACSLTAPAEQDVVGGCPSGQKACSGHCVSLDDPRYGCNTDGCSPCPAANGTASCQSGVCAIAGCNSGFGDCNHTPSDGCEANFANDPNNCSQCDKACTSGVCASGACCKALGDACSSAVDCCGNNCQGACCAARGQTCKSAADCCMGVMCTNSKCCNPSGASCSEDEDCCGNNCAGTCQ